MYVAPMVSMSTSMFELPHDRKNLFHGDLRARLGSIDLNIFKNVPKVHRTWVGILLRL